MPDVLHQNKVFKTNVLQNEVVPTQASFRNRNLNVLLPASAIPQTSEKTATNCDMPRKGKGLQKHHHHK